MIAVVVAAAALLAAPIFLEETPQLGAATAAPSPTPAPAATPRIPGDGPAMEEFVQMIDRRIDSAGDPAAVEKIDAEIRAKYEKPTAVMITDMTGMTSTTKKSGILAMFSLIREMQRTTLPSIQANGARWVKIDADDLFVVHSSAKSLLATARGARDAAIDFEKKNHQAIGLAIGLSFGPTLVVGDEELWGDPVNVASKLGEDTAESGEILASEDFVKQLAAEGVTDACKPVPKAKQKLKFRYFTCK